MKTLKTVLLVGGATAALLGAGPAAGALAATNSGDAAATATFLNSTQQMLESSIAAVPSMKRSASAFVRHINACAAPLKGIPNTPTKAQAKVGLELFQEMTFDMVLAVMHPDDHALRTHASALAGLHWSSARLTRAVASYAADERVMSQAPGDPCPDLRAAAADHFTQLPAGTARLISRLGGAPNGPDLGALLRLMAPAASAAERTQIAHVRGLNAQMQHKMDAALNGVMSRLGNARD